MAKKSPITKYTLKDGSARYQFQLHVGRDPMTGKRKSTRRRGFRTREQAKVEYNRLKAKLDRDGTIKKITPIDQKKTFKDVYDEWMIIYKEKVKPITYLHMKSNAENKVLPFFGNKFIDKIKGNQLQKFVTDISKQYADSARFTTTVKNVFHYAYKMGYVDNDEFLKVDIPRRRAKKHVKIDDDVLTKEELDKYLLFLRNEDGIEHYSFFYLLAHTGMRRGEALALKWSDIQGNKLRIQRTITKSYDGTFQLGKNTKTNSSDRTIVLDKGTLSVLTQWHLSINNKLKRRGYVNHDDLIFPSTSKGKILIHNPNWPNKILRTLQKKFHQLHVVDVHGFRHTWATLALDAGLSVRDVQKQLGHASYATTMNIYGKYTKQQQEKATTKMEAFWSGSQNKKSGSQK